MEQRAAAADLNFEDDEELTNALAQRRMRLDVISNSAQKAPGDAANGQGTPTWLSERDFARTLELVDRAAEDLEVAERRIRELEAQHETLLNHANEKFDAAQALVRAAEERALRAEAHSESLDERARRAEARARDFEERALRAESRAKDAEEQSRIDRDWLLRIQRSVEQFATRRGEAPSDPAA
jgi:hypothetical protein